MMRAPTAKTRALYRRRLHGIAREREAEEQQDQLQEAQGSSLAKATSQKWSQLPSLGLQQARLWWWLLPLLLWYTAGAAAKRPRTFLTEGR